MTLSDCFRILGIPSSACLNDLKIAYRTKAKEYHPDRNGGDGRQFTRLHEAYTFLLDNGTYYRGPVHPQAEKERRESEEMARREAFRKAAEDRAMREKLRRAAREQARKESEQNAAREKLRREREKRAAERREVYEEKYRQSQLKAAKAKAKRAAKEDSPSHRVFIAGEILNGNFSLRQKKQAIQTLVSLKRKSAYPFLKKALNNESEQIVIPVIDAIGKLKIIQAEPELYSLMCCGNVRIRMAVLESIEGFGKAGIFSEVIRMALGDKVGEIRGKAEKLYKRVYE